ncbi:MAG: UMP kinase [bacterium]|nr:UMP kinase [bacterium]MDZ4231607.1 UMP kinase [Patescibacteria group bacterium]
MKHSFGKTYVVALGGSIVFPEGIDIDFVKRFKKLVEGLVEDGHRFVLVVGGGKLARMYQDAAGKLVKLSDREKDWIGIHATRSNAQLLHAIFKGMVERDIFDERGKIAKLRKPITIGSGWKPGWSTDFVTSAIAKDLGVSEFIIAGKPDYVYDKDPARYRDAKAFDHLTWDEYRELVPAKWVPGASVPVDPVAAAFAKRNKLKAIVVDGRDLPNFKRLLKGQTFAGTLIE